jgi:hypothetical protein
MERKYSSKGRIANDGMAQGQLLAKRVSKYSSRMVES